MTKFNYSENILLDGQELLEAIDKYEGNLLKSRAWYKKLLCIDLPSYDLRPYWKKMLRIGRGKDYVPSTYKWWE